MQSSENIGTAIDPVIMAEEMRLKLKDLEVMARQFAEVLKSPHGVPLFDKGECIADSILALRHIEDARMRYGKVIQYATNGESSFKK